MDGEFCPCRAIEYTLFVVDSPQAPSTEFGEDTGRSKADVFQGHTNRERGKGKKVYYGTIVKNVHHGIIVKKVHFGTIIKKVHSGTIVKKSKFGQFTQQKHRRDPT